MTPIDSGKNTLTFKRITSQIKSKSNYFSYSVLGSIILFFKQLVYSQYLGVVEFGFYSIFLLTFAYGSYSMGLGFNQGLLRFLPEARLQEKERYVNVIRNNVITASLIIGVIEAIIFIPATFLFVEDSRLSFVLIYAIIYTIIIIFIRN